MDIVVVFIHRLLLGNQPILVPVYNESEGTGSQVPCSIALGFRQMRALAYLMVRQPFKMRSSRTIS